MPEYNFQTLKQMDLLRNSHISAVYEFWVTEFALIFQTNKCVTVTGLDFVFDNKTVKEHLKKH